MARRDEEAAAFLRTYFGACLERYGHDPRGVDWQSAAAQRARFAAVLAVGDLGGATALVAVDPADWLACLRTLSPAAQARLLDPWGDAVFLLRKATAPPADGPGGA